MSSQRKFMKFVVNLFIAHIIISLISSVQLNCNGAPASARVKYFPGYHGNLNSEIYAGYVTVGEVNGIELFYYFVKSERNPAKDPLLLWLTGGPGCSSFTGFAYELGPMSFDLNNNSGNLPTLISNPHSWTKVSNIIFLDSPVGTGFSYSNTTTDYVTGDFKSVSDIHTFLIKWFEAFPEFLSNPIYVGGDSYSGMVVPLVVHEIANGNEAGIKPTLNLKGYLVGNGGTDEAFDNAQVPFAHGKGLISDELYQAVKETCNNSYLYSTNASCLSNLLAMWKDLIGINTAHILDPICFPISKKQESLSSQKILTKRYEKLEVFDQLLESRRRMSSHGWFTKSSEDGYLTVQLQLGYQDRPCPTVDKYQLSYIWAKNPYVRKAIHAQSEEITGEWKRCTPRFKYNYDVRSVIEYHRNLTRKGYRALIYSGDHDLIVPFIGTQAWIRSLNYTIVDDWRPWWVDRQVAGYTRLYDNNLTFATVKGGGHTAPEYKPRQTFVMFKQWTSGEPL
uniref:Uncharacterized protein n=1 Tax=Picea sitchensis TaxID=3332 RepID=B8LL22_PICSI|nr:unknown [Picea sitchensis]